ncbi:MAG: hypothetical protein AB7N91_17230 [Candidatus Tectimicrobiota bacterium]
MGNRSRKSAKKLWAKIPQASREQARFSTDQSGVYAGVIPAAPHQAITKKARETHHIGAIKHVICEYNLLKEKG